MDNLITIAFYENAIQANFAKQKLADSGIKSYIANEQTIQSDWLLSQALGGIQLQVFEGYEEEANKVLATEDQGLEVDYTIDNSPYDFNCPNCGSNHIYRDEKPGGIFGISILLLGIPFKQASTKYHCYYCNQEFEKKEN